MTTVQPATGSNIPELVLAYFQTYEQSARPLARIVDQPGLGAFRVHLFGELADRFKGVSEPDEGGGGRVLGLLLRPPLGADRPRGYEYPAPRSRLLRLIRNDLSGRAGYTRSVAVLTLLGTFDELETFGIRAHGAEPTASLSFRWDRYYLVTFLLRVEGPEPIDETIRVAVTADGLPLPMGVVRFTELEQQLIDAREARGEYAAAAAAVGPTRDAAEHALRQARNEAESRAQPVVRGRVAASERKQGEKRSQLVEFYKREVVDKNPVQRRSLEADRDRNLAQIQALFKVEAALTLVSFQEILIPIASYQLAVRGTPLGHMFAYDPIARTVRSAPCRRCQQGSNILEWVFCSSGHHLECKECNTIRRCGEPTCRNTGCADHSAQCAEFGCEKRLCGDHARRCAHCSRPERYCRSHIPDGADGWPICQTCRVVCHDCGELFPHTAVVGCVECRALVCETDRGSCAGCGEFLCGQHGLTVSGRVGRFCPNCRGECKDCDPGVLHPAEELEPCGRCHKLVCTAPSHRFRCVVSGTVLCQHDKLDTLEGPGSTLHFGMCQTCQIVHAGQAKAIRRSGLTSCRLCPPGDAGLHCQAMNHSTTCVSCNAGVCQQHAIRVASGGVGCKEARCVGKCRHCKLLFPRRQIKSCHKCGQGFCIQHLRTCEVCAKAFCPADLRELADGRFVCTQDADACIDCRKWYRKSELVGCSACGQLVCRIDQKRPSFGEGIYCSGDAQKFVGCNGCGRRGPADQLVNCQCCGIDYCTLCYTQPTDLACRYCYRLETLEPHGTMSRWAKRFEDTACPNEVPVADWARIADALAGGVPNYRFLAYTGDRLEYLVAEHRGSFFARVRRLFARPWSCLLVWDRSADLLMVRINPNFHRVTS